MAKFLDSTGVTQLVQQLDLRYKPMSYNPPATTLASLGITATAAEINKLDGLAATATELGYVHGVTSSIQTQLDSKQAKLTAGTGISISGSTISCTLDTTIYKVVEDLPASPAAGDANKIHLVPDDNGSGQNVYIEYLWTGSKWEMLGQSSASTEIAIDNITGLGSGWLAALKAAKPNWSVVGHTHEISDIDGLQDALDDKANATHTHTGAQVTLTGYVLGTVQAIAATDTVNTAFGKVQASLNAKANASALSGYVPTTRTINGQALSGNITLTGENIEVGGSGTYAGGTVTAAIDALDEKIDGLDIPSIEGLLTNVTASGSGGLTLSASKAGTVVNITGSVALDGADIKLTGYTKGTASTAVAATDTVNQAIAKLENQIDAVEGDIPVIPNISVTNGTAESGKYISAIAATGHTITVTKASLPAVPTRASSMTVACTSGAETSTTVNLAAATASFTIGVMSESDIEAAIAAATA